MKAYEIAPGATGAPLRLVDRPTPALGPFDVRVGVRAVSLNYRDLVIARMAANRTRPVVPASDGAGEVLAVGDQVTRVRIGDRVAAGFFPTWTHGDLREAHHADALGGARDGMLAEQVVLPETAWVALPDAVTYAQAATLPCAGVTAWHALFESGAPLRAGDALLVQGSGGVSVFAMQLARAAGATIIATTGSPAKRAALEALGASAVIDYRATPAWGEAVRAATGGRGVDLAVEVGGPGTFDQSVAALRFGGSLALIGVLTGTSGPINTHAIVHKNLRVRGIYVGSTAMFADLLRAIVANRIEPVIDRSFGFGDAQAAYDHLASGRHIGKVVVALG